MKYDDEVDPHRITRGMRDRVEALFSAAEYIDVLADVALSHVKVMEEVLARHSSIPYRDWQIISAVLHLATNQAEIVKDVAEDFRTQRVQAIAA